MLYDRTGEVWLLPSGRLSLIVGSRCVGVDGAKNNPVMCHERVHFEHGDRSEFTETRGEWPMEKWAGFTRIS